MTGCVDWIFATSNMLLIVIARFCCSSVVSDDDYNFFDDDFWLALWVRRWLISPLWAFSILPHSGHGMCLCGVSGMLVIRQSILGKCFPVGDIDAKSHEGLLKSVLEVFLLPTN